MRGDAFAWFGIHGACHMVFEYESEKIPEKPLSFRQGKAVVASPSKHSKINAGFQFCAVSYSRGMSHGFLVRKR
jgi:hypothetical protein